MIRKAKILDAKKIYELINYYAKKELMLYRSLNDIYENIRDFSVYEDKKGDVLGACALHIGWEGMGEIRSLAVKQGYTKKGIGRDLVEGIFKEALEFEIKSIFVLTYVPHFFKKIGFKEINKKRLPQKVWTECVNCPKFPNCDETAMLFKRN